jgi:hypothetical protein
MRVAENGRAGGAVLLDERDDVLHGFVPDAVYDLDLGFAAVEAEHPANGD